MCGAVAQERVLCADVTSPRSVVAMTRCGDDVVAVCLEGTDEVALVRLHAEGITWHLAICTSAPVSSVLMPSDVASVRRSDGATVLYVVGGPCAVRTNSLHLGCALVSGAVRGLLWPSAIYARSRATARCRVRVHTQYHLPLSTQSTGLAGPGRDTR